MRYIGNKKRLIENINSFIDKNVKEYCYDFCDIFAGTGSVGNFFQNRYRITSNDYLHYSYILNKGLLCGENKFEKLGYNPFEYFNNMDEKSLICGFFYTHYSPGGSERKYFSEHNAKKIDTIRYELEELLKKQLINNNEYYYLLMCLVESASKVSNTTGVYGAYLKKWDSRSIKVMEFLQIDLNEHKYENVVYNKDSKELLKEINGDILYIDPPYTNTQYCDQYHVLETLTKYDNPNIFGITGKRNTSQIKSNFSYKKSATDEFDELIHNAEFKHIIMSYSDHGIIPKESIIKILIKYGDAKTLNIQEIEYRRFENARTKKNKKLNEYLFYIKKN